MAVLSSTLNSYVAVAGFAVPWYFFLTFLLENGTDLGLFIQYLLANRISVFFAADLMIVALATLFYLWSEERKQPNSRWWLFAGSTLVIGPSFSIPLYLYFRERRANERDC